MAKVYAVAMVHTVVDVDFATGISGILAVVVAPTVWFLHPCCWHPLMFLSSVVSVGPSVDVLLLML